MTSWEKKAKDITDLLSRMYKPLYFDMLSTQFKAGYRFRVYDKHSNEFYAVELSYMAIMNDDKLLGKLIPQIEDFHKKHYSKLAKLLRGEE